MGLYFPAEEYQDRWGRVDRAMRENGYDVAVIWSRSGGTYDRCGDVLYLTNYVSTESGQEPDNKVRRASAFAAVILIAGDTPLLVADESDSFPNRASLCRGEPTVVRCGGADRQ